MSPQLQQLQNQLLEVIHHLGWVEVARWSARARYTSDLRDTATPDDMAAFLLKLQRGELLPAPYSRLLLDLLARVTTGPHRLKYRLPPDTVVAHKTGTTAVVINDVGLITLPGDAGHLALAVFVMNGRGAATMQKIIADVGAVTYESFTGQALPPPVKAVKSATRPSSTPPTQLP